MDENKLEQLERRLDDLDRRESAMERAMEKAMASSRAAMAHILPSETRRHMRNAGREQLMAVRSLLDYWVERMDDRSKASEQANNERENIPID
jgi:hypothetical protein